MGCALLRKAQLGIPVGKERASKRDSRAGRLLETLI